MLHVDSRLSSPVHDQPELSRRRNLHHEQDDAQLWCFDRHVLSAVTSSATAPVTAATLAITSAAVAITSAAVAIPSAALALALALSAFALAAAKESTIEARTKFL